MRIPTFRQAVLFSSATTLVALVALVVKVSARPRPTFEQLETKRVRAHFDSVLAELGPRDVSSLSAEQRARRARLFRTLAAYRDRGLFPHNYDVPGRIVPTFVDPVTHVRCAVGELLASTGRDDITQRVASANVHVYAAELGIDREFTTWLDENGLTLAEASRIQPGYGGNVIIVKPVNQAKQNIDIGLAATSGLLATWNLAANRDGHSARLNSGGMLLGFLSVMIGAATDQDREVTHKAANGAMMAGGASMIVSGIEAWHHAREQRTERRLSVVPLVGSNGVAGVRFAGHLPF